MNNYLLCSTIVIRVTRYASAFYSKMETLHERLQICAKSKGISQSDVARATRIPMGTMSRYFTGGSQPKSTELYTLAVFFGVSMEWLLVGDDARDFGKTVTEEEAVRYHPKKVLSTEKKREILEKLEAFSEQLKEAFPDDEETS